MLTLTIVASKVRPGDEMQTGDGRWHPVARVRHEGGLALIGGRERAWEKRTPLRSAVTVRRVVVTVRERARRREAIRAAT